jgi:RimJ/RimL family protein N-acetyltransferase
VIEIAGFDIRYSTLDDLSFLQEMFEEESSLDPFPFGQREKDEALKNWIGFSRFKASLTAVINGEPCAVGTLFLMPYKKVAHHCSFYLIVDPEHRQKGIGTSMVKNLLHLAKNRFRLDGVNVELYEPSPLLSILERERFTLFVRQENYAKIRGESRARLLLEHFFV